MWFLRWNCGALSSSLSIDWRISFGSHFGICISKNKVSTFDSSLLDTIDRSLSHQHQNLFLDYLLCFFFLLEIWKMRCAAIYNGRSLNIAHAIQNANWAFEEFNTAKANTINLHSTPTRTITPFSLSSWNESNSHASWRIPMNYCMTYEYLATFYFNTIVWVELGLIHDPFQYVCVFACLFIRYRLEWSKAPITSSLVPFPYLYYLFA